MPAEWEPHRATWIAWPHHEAGLARKIRTDSLGVCGDRSRDRAARTGRDPLPVGRGRRVGARDARAHACAARSHSPARRADRSRLAARLGADRACATRRAMSCCSTGSSMPGPSTTTGHATIGVGAAVASLTGLRREEPAARGTASASCSRAAASTSTATACSW